jgi:hypothetical protein
MIPKHRPSPLVRPALFLAVIAALPMGCTTVPYNNAQSFATGVSAAQNQTHTVFTAAAQLIRQTDIDYASAQDVLSPALFAATPSQDAIAAWDGIFAPIEKYASQLAALVNGTAQSAQLQTAVTGLAGAFNTAATDLGKSTGAAAGNVGTIAAGFTQLANTLIANKEQHEAMAIATAADTDIKNIFTTMADAIGTTAADGLRGTIGAHWVQRESEVGVQFAVVAKQCRDLKAGLTGKTASDQAAQDQLAKLAASRQQLASSYADLLDQQDAEDLALAALRTSYLALADAHHALISGQPASLDAAIGSIMDQLKSAADLQKQITAQLSKTATK